MSLSTTFVWNGLYDAALDDGADYALCVHDDTEFYPLSGKYWTDVLVGSLANNALWTNFGVSPPPPPPSPGRRPAPRWTQTEFVEQEGRRSGACPLGHNSSLSLNGTLSGMCRIRTFPGSGGEENCA